MDKVMYGSNLGSADTNRGPSPTIWGKCPVIDITKDPRTGIHQWDDFIEIPHITTPTITTEAAIGGKLGYKAFGSSGGTLVSGGSQYGDLVFTETDDNQGIGLATIALPYRIARGYGHVAMEARVKTSVITDNENGFFIGFQGQQTLSATVPIAAAGTLADNNFVGFHRLEGDGDQIDCVYKANGVTQVTALADASPSALVAGTYFKVGFFYDDNTKILTYYINGLPVKSYTMATADGTDFPNDVPMGLCAAMLCASNNDSVLTMDWWRAAQWFNG